MSNFKLYMEIREARVKKWGNSMGVVIPRKIVESQNLKENDRVVISLIKEADLSDVFGSLKRKKSGQDFKDEVRQGWEN